MGVIDCFFNSPPLGVQPTDIKRGYYIPAITRGNQKTQVAGYNHKRFVSHVSSFPAMSDYYYKGILCLSYGFMRKRPGMLLDNQRLSTSVPYTGQRLEHGEIIASAP